MMFELQGPDNRLVVQWGGGKFCGEMPIVSEEDMFGLVIHNATPGSQYVIDVGEERIDAECRWFASACELEKGPYFESAYAKTVLAVMRRGEDRIVEKVAECEVYVLPSKIGHENYQQMVGDLQMVCRSLINDLIGKSFRYFFTF